jgi:hypothetical protein
MGFILEIDIFLTIYQQLNFGAKQEIPIPIIKTSMSHWNSFFFSFALMSYTSALQKGKN